MDAGRQSEGDASAAESADEGFAPDNHVNAGVVLIACPLPAEAGLKLKCGADPGLIAPGQDNVAMFRLEEESDGRGNIPDAATGLDRQLARRIEQTEGVPDAAEAAH